MDFVAALAPDAYPAGTVAPSQPRMWDVPRKLVSRRYCGRGALEQQSAWIQHNINIQQQIEEKAGHASSTGQHG